MNHNSVSFVYQIMKPLIILSMGVCLLEFANSSFDKLGLMNATMDTVQAKDFYKLCISGGAGVALMFYSVFSIIMIIIEHINILLKKLLNLFSKYLDNRFGVSRYMQSLTLRKENRKTRDVE